MTGFDGFDQLPSGLQAMIRYEPNTLMLFFYRYHKYVFQYNIKWYGKYYVFEFGGDHHDIYSAVFPRMASFAKLVSVADLKTAFEVMS